MNINPAKLSHLIDTLGQYELTYTTHGFHAKRPKESTVINLTDEEGCIVLAYLARKFGNGQVMLGVFDQDFIKRYEKQYRQQHQQPSNN